MTLHVLPQTPFITWMQTLARNTDSDRERFTYATDRVNRALLDFALGQTPFTETPITTPTGAQFTGCAPERPIHGVSVVRAGESMERILRDVLPHVPIGKILVQRDPETLDPHYFYEKLPSSISEATVILMEPMLATGGSLRCAINCLLEAGVPEKNIVSVNYLASPDGLNSITRDFPDITIVVASIETALTEQGYMLPGIGDFGDRYYA